MFIFNTTKTIRFSGIKNNQLIKTRKYSKYEQLVVLMIKFLPYFRGNNVALVDNTLNIDYY